FSLIDIVNTNGSSLDALLFNVKESILPAIDKLLSTRSVSFVTSFTLIIVFSGKLLVILRVICVSACTNFSLICTGTSLFAVCVVTSVTLIVVFSGKLLGIVRVFCVSAISNTSLECAGTSLLNGKIVSFGSSGFSGNSGISSSFFIEMKGDCPCSTVAKASKACSVAMLAAPALSFCHQNRPSSC